MTVRINSTGGSSDVDQDLLEEIRERYTYAMNEWRDIRAEAKMDMRYVAGDPWTPADRKQRQDAGRPCLSLDELHQYFNQLINSVRANPRAPKFDPSGNGANDQTARFYGDKYREVEYRSQAQIAYTTAFQNAVHQGYGWLRFTTKWQRKGFVQDLWIEELPNPDLIVSDPDALRPSSSDQKYLFNLRSLSVQEFKREFPDAQITSFTPEIISQAPAWISTERVQIAEYWTVEPEARTLLQLQSPTGETQACYEDDLESMPAGWTVIDRRTDDVPTVCMYLTNGVEILTKPGQTEKKVRWAGQYIPFVSCVGMVIYVDEGSGPKRKILSMTRLARDPYMLYCYYRTAQAELVGMTPKIPYFVRRGSLKPQELLNLQKSLHEPIAVIEVENFVDGMPGQPPEMPVRNPYEPFIQNLEIGAESARRAIQAAMGVSPLPTQAQQRNQKSGIALQQIESSEQKGSFHFIDHFDEMLQQCGVIYEDLVGHVYDTARDVGVRDAQGQARTVRINDPSQPPSDKALPSVGGDHTVTVSEGPAFESQRAEASSFLDTLIGNIQMVAAIAGPKAAAAMLGIAIKMKNLGPMGDELADLVTPMEFQQKDGMPGLPPQAQAAMMQLQQENQQLKGALQGKTAEIQAKGQIDLQKTQLQEQADTQRTQLEQAVKIQVAQIQGESAFAVASLKAQIESVNTALAALQAERAADHQTRQHAIDAAQFLADRHSQQAAQAHELGMAAVDHAATLAQQDQIHRQALEQGQQAAALAPADATGEP